MDLVRRIKSTLGRVWRNITIEPVVALYLTALGLNEVIRPNLLIEKSCLYVHNYTQEICDELSEDAFKAMIRIKLSVYVNKYFLTDRVFSRMSWKLFREL